MADTEPEIEIAPLNDREDVTADVRAAFEQSSEPAETQEQRTERLRDESGKFVAKDKVAAPDVAAQPTPVTDADQPTEQPVQHSRADGPPRGWSADEKAAWSTLPPAIQAAVSRREQEVSDGFRQLSEQRSAQDRALAPVAQIAQNYGMPVDDAIARLVGVEQRLGNPSSAAQTIAELAQAYGVDLTALVNGTPQPRPAAPQFDPNQLLQTVEQRIDAKWQERQQTDALNSTINTFASTHEHFPKVRELMGHLIQSEQATGNTPAEQMQDAYDKAIWATQDIRTQLIAAQAAPAAKPRVDPRRAAVSVTGSPRGQAPVKREEMNGSVIDDVRAAFAEHRG